MGNNFSNANNMSNMNNASRRAYQNGNFTQNTRQNTRENVRSENSDASCEELMRAIMEADFFAQDLKLYLDTHPDDMKAVEMFREAVRQSKACKAAFEESFYPLTAHAAGKDGVWDWLDGNFPPKS